MRKTFLAVAAALLLAGSLASSASAADKLKVGFITGIEIGRAPL
jgi:ABC-type sugar transport system substrate-binding protein